jgi:hypothetical protein
MTVKDLESRTHQDEKSQLLDVDDAITSLILQHPDIQREFFGDVFGRIGKYFRSPREPLFELAGRAITPEPFYSDALQCLLASHLVVISGPPHLGKTTLARRMAMEVVSRNSHFALHFKKFDAVRTQMDRHSRNQIFTKNQDLG